MSTDGRLYRTVAELESRIDQLERKVEHLLGFMRCEPCSASGPDLVLTRCLRCERDLCPACIAKETCAHAKDSKHV